MKKIYILSYPRSGSFWVRWCLEFLLQTTRISDHPKRSFQFALKNNRVNLSTIFKPIDEYKLLKDHGVNQNFDDGNTTLIMVLRNYKECIPRQIIYKAQTKQQALNQYVRMIKRYDKWNGKKFIVYYEDLITDPEKTLENLINIIDTKYVKNIKLLMQDYEEHKKGSLERYTTTGGKPESMTKGNSIIFHSKKLTIEQKQDYDQFIKLYKFCKKYLERYYEKN